MMCDLGDYDLAEPAAILPDGPRPTRVLVWWRNQALGEVIVHPDWSNEERDDALRRPFTDAVTALTLVGTSLDRPTDASSLAVVVLAHGPTSMLEQCLRSLSMLDPAPAELVVVDVATDDEARLGLIEGYGARRVPTAAGTTAAARNAGWQATRSSTIAFIDDRTRPHRRWAGALGTAFDTDGIDCVSGLTLSAELTTPPQRWLDRDRSFPFAPALLGRATSVAVLDERLGGGMNMAFRRTALERLGGFDEALGRGTAIRSSGDEVDAFIRVFDSGGAAFHEPNAVVRHVSPRTFRTLVQWHHDAGFVRSELEARYRDREAYAPGSDDGRPPRFRTTRRTLGALRHRDRVRLATLGTETVAGWAGAASQRAHAAATRRGDACQ
jgi:GT2 family glycosyltransferase